jgi:seryl-tRNA synthetase
MAVDAASLAAEIERRNKQLTDEIGELLHSQSKIQQRISELLAKKAATTRKAEIRELRGVRDEANKTIGILAAERTDLLDGLPVVLDAAGVLDVQAKRLAKDAALIERAAAKVKRATEKIAKAERLIIKIGSMLKPLIL